MLLHPPRETKGQSMSDEYDNMFSWHLEYQETDDFKSDAHEQQDREKAQLTLLRNKASAKYRKSHLELVAMRKDARQYAERLYQDQQGLCKWCKIKLGDYYEIDHIHPLIKGGSNEYDNLCVTCQHCNQKKAAKIIKVR